MEVSGWMDGFIIMMRRRVRVSESEIEMNVKTCLILFPISLVFVFFKHWTGFFFLFYDGVP